jgi:hypothetical protein
LSLWSGHIVLLQQFFEIMNLNWSALTRAGALLAINLLFLSLWGFAAIGKLVDRMPSWFASKFGKTFLGSFPGGNRGFLAGGSL